VARLHVTPDPYDPHLFLVTSDPEENSLPVIPTAPAHEYWVSSSVLQEQEDPGRSVSPNHPSVMSWSGPGTG
jgi:hypothetical protein